jgi:hypothetical protein
MKTLHLITALWLATLSSPAAESRTDLVVHEWGTFTSVQGGDGVLLAWQPFLTPDLPAFVYDWRRPGLGRQMPVAMTFGKGGIRSLQRMETPVIYFYSDHELTADVTVKFPSGFITEWYPQAQQIGSANAVGLAANPDRAALSASLENSSISWRGLQILPATTPDLTKQLPTDKSDNHYFAARETDSAFIKLANGGTNGTTPELEKLLFYRGTGNFATPLKTTVSEDGTLSVANTGDQPLTGLFLVEMRNGAGKWTTLEKLSPGQKHRWQTLAALETQPALGLEILSPQLGAQLEQALVRAGLYPREAAAMVKTWSKSWFAEDGVRVLYILPREWTDATLPLTLKPSPRELVRVMVGRAEIIPPQQQRDLAAEISKERSGDKEAAQRLRVVAQKLGRFYAPAYQLAAQRVSAPLNKPVAAASFE